MNIGGNEQINSEIVFILGLVIGASIGYTGILVLALAGSAYYCKDYIVTNIAPLYHSHRPTFMEWIGLKRII